MKRTLALFLATAGLGACSSLGIGGGEFACNGMPDGVRCMSARDVYTLTDDRDSLDQATVDALTGKAAPAAPVPEPEQDGEPSLIQASLPAPAAAMGRPVPAAYAPGAAATPVPWIDDGRVPVRTPASVMRVWIASWETPAGDLVMPSLIYTEIAPRRWQLGLPTATTREVLQPLAASAAPTSKK